MEDREIAELTETEAKDLLAEIHSILSGKEWDSDTASAVAESFRDYGVEVEDLGA